MRKNAVNRQLYPIEGGICAPKGFLAGAVYCGFKKGEEGEKDLALIKADRCYPTAAVFTENSIQGAPVVLSKKHIKDGMAQAILINSGVALACNEKADEIAKNIALCLAEHFRIQPTDVLLASTGRLGEKIEQSLYTKGIAALKEGLSNEKNASEIVAQAIITTDINTKHGAFMFELGEYPINIGFVVKGNGSVCPNMATTLCVLTTDANITAKMLQKALSSQVRETLNMLNVDGISSINDTVYIMSSCQAGNAKIDVDDTEYKKFAFALKQVLTIISKQIASDNGAHRLIECNVSSAKSKQVARNIAKNCVGSAFFKKSVADGVLNVSQLVNLLGDIEKDFKIQKTQIRLCGQEKSLLIFEDGRAIPYSKDFAARLLSEEKVVLSIQLRDGNYSATAWGNVTPFEPPVFRG